MKIDKETIDKLLEIQKSYVEIHSKYDDLANKISKLKDERDELFDDLSKLRSYERSIINKIEEETGVKMTSDELIKILKNED